MENRKLEQKSLEKNLRRSIRSSPTGPIDGPLIKEIAAQGKNHDAIDFRKEVKSAMRLQPPWPNNYVESITSVSTRVEECF